MLNEDLKINQEGHLLFGGADTVALAKQYGTPLYVMNENRIRKICNMYKQSIEKCYHGNGLPLFASKAFCCKEICRIMNDEGMGLDVVSGGELYTAMQAGFPPERIQFHGNNKTTEEMKYALTCGVGHFVVDNLTELHTLDNLAGCMHGHANILLRIKPGIDAHTHKFIRTGQIDSKFGFALETGEAMAAVKEALQAKNVTLTGLHCHIGSQIFEIQPFLLAAKVMLTFIRDIKAETGAELQELNLGGGFGIKYTEQDQPVPYDQYMEQVSKTVHSCCSEYNLALPKIYIEPGRSIVGESGLTLYTIGAVKSIPNTRTYVSVDGGMTDNPRYILYQSTYEAIVANKAEKPRDYTVTIAGRCCESGDLIQEHTPIQKCAPGDILAVLSTGAYNYSMASNYNRVPRPAVVFVKDGSPRVAVRRESYADLVQNDL
ncbi:MULTISPECIES: diaminopimelate decarboxylase [Caproicibacterium]|uniref:Diaminopimelate decarboxylase n=1 Tax=Caproicibacterium lactatifermentans TaxID=2666138 RepID=A0A859DR43_9FIRM|nr:diaminopimelate decarboxylase [Caproicibacterium lactatifermentans]ARP51280.1 diaminopimelate decarboxylase [Ruminococcaceae bacterium CPB6]QKN23969.1 diaminopimelate decarboxylase [Caproicibacterium lactatifermentans]QKO30959.1 diaminopimelate decarboxylase [Caproicibacterium lactatifermentans]